MLNVTYPNHPHSISSLFLLGGHLSVPNFEKGEIRKKISAWLDLKSPCQGYLPWGLTMFVVKKLLKIKYSFEGSISNADLGLF